MLSNNHLEDEIMKLFTKNAASEEMNRRKTTMKESSALVNDMIDFINDKDLSKDEFQKTGYFARVKDDFEKYEKEENMKHDRRRVVNFVNELIELASNKQKEIRRSQSVQMASCSSIDHHTMNQASSIDQTPVMNQIVKVQAAQLEVLVKVSEALDIALVRDHSSKHKVDEESEASSSCKKRRREQEDEKTRPERDEVIRGATKQLVQIQGKQLEQSIKTDKHMAFLGKNMGRLADAFCSLHRGAPDDDESYGTSGSVIKDPATTEWVDDKEKGEPNI